MLNEPLANFSTNPEDDHVHPLVVSFYQAHRNPQKVFKINLLAESELLELTQNTNLSLMEVKNQLYAMDRKSVIDPIFFGHFQSLGHLKNDISPQALIDLGSEEEARANDFFPKPALAHLENTIELAIYHAFYRLQDESGIQYDQIILDNEQDINHAVVLIKEGSFNYHVENMSEPHRINFEQHLYEAMGQVRYWLQVYA